MSCENCGGSTLKLLSLVLETVTQEEKDKRINSCIECNEYKSGICKQCLCIIDIKSSIKQQSCPLNKWDI